MRNAMPLHQTHIFRFLYFLPYSLARRRISFFFPLLLTFVFFRLFLNPLLYSVVVRSSSATSGASAGNEHISPASVNPSFPPVQAPAIESSAALYSPRAPMEVRPVQPVPSGNSSWSASPPFSNTAQYTSLGLFNGPLGSLVGISLEPERLTMGAWDKSAEQTREAPNHIAPQPLIVDLTPGPPPPAITKPFRFEDYATRPSPDTLAPNCIAAPARPVTSAATLPFQPDTAPSLSTQAPSSCTSSQVKR